MVVILQVHMITTFVGLRCGWDEHFNNETRQGASLDQTAPKRRGVAASLSPRLNNAAPEATCCGGAGSDSHAAWHMAAHLTGMLSTFNFTGASKWRVGLSPARSLHYGFW